MILKITDECVMDHELVDIRNAIGRRCFAKMQANINQEIILYNDFHVEVRDPRQRFAIGKKTGASVAN